MGTTVEGYRGPCFKLTNLVGTTFLIDLFAKKPELRLPSGSTRYTSMTGCLCSLIYIVVVLSFGFISLRDILDKNEVTTSNKVNRNYWDPM